MNPNARPHLKSPPAAPEYNSDILISFPLPLRLKVWKQNQKQDNSGGGRGERHQDEEQHKAETLARREDNSAKTRRARREGGRGGTAVSGSGVDSEPKTNLSVIAGRRGQFSGV